MTTSHLSRGELIALGRTTVTDRLQNLGCTVGAPSTHGALEVTTPSGRNLDVYVSTQRTGGYVFWTKRRLQPDSTRFAAIMLLSEDEEPSLYLVPTTEWLHASPPFTDRDNIGKKSEPEFGISLARSSLPALERYRWDDMTAADYFR
jgi:hypothetical protein